MNIIKAESLDMDELSTYRDLNEKQLKRFYEPAEGLFICESEKVIRRALDAGYEAESLFAEESKVGSISDMTGANIPMYVAPFSVMKKITGYSLTGGVLAAMRRKPLQKPAMLTERRSRIVVLDDVENPTNVGAIFRSAAALGVEAVLLTKGCSDPLYRRAARVSMGTVFSIPWTYADHDDIAKMSEKGFYTMAMVLSEKAISIADIDRTYEKRAVILGNEDQGVSARLRKYADADVIIPMDNDVDSLNVAAAGAVAFWEVFKSGDAGQ